MSTNKNMSNVISIIIPTYNAQNYVVKLLDTIKAQSINNFELIIIDSSSQDNTVEIAKQYTDQVIVIPQDEFSHGGTRAKAAKMAKGDILVYLTQDALPFNEYAIENIVKAFEDEKVAAAYGRQLPYPDEKVFGEHLRIFNYGGNSYKLTYEDKEKLGIKTAFLSDSFAAYRRETLEEIGWFKEDLNFGEDMHAGARLLKAGYSLAYVADAKVYHSHSYTFREEFLRYFETGQFHQQEHWLLDEFGKPEGEGMRFVKSELDFLIQKKKYHLLALSLVRNAVKLLGYKWGKSLYKMSKGSQK